MSSAQSPHGELIKKLLPPVSYDILAPKVAAAADADGLTLDRVHGAAKNVCDGLTPFTFTEWIEEYERAYGLPGPCFSGQLSLDERIVQLSIALRERYGISREFYYWLAGVFGYNITIEEYKPFIAGSHAGERLFNGLWQYAWVVRTLEAPIRPFRAGRSSSGDPLNLWGDTRFECIFRRFSPAHTVVHFAYGNNDI